MKTLYFRNDKKSRVWFISDIHALHGNIIKYCNRNIYLSDYDRSNYESNGADWTSEWGRSYRVSQESTETMTKSLIDNINYRVAENDILLELGDFAFAHESKYYSTCKRVRDSIVCRNMYHIWGNHDTEDHFNRGEFIKGINDLFVDCFDLVRIVVNGQPIVLCHFFNAVWEKSHRGSWHLYGHSHSGIEKWADSIMPGRKAMDVGVDNIYKLFGEYRPISFEEVSTIMNKRTGFNNHH